MQFKRYFRPLVYLSLSILCAGMPIYADSITIDASGNPGRDSTDGAEGSGYGGDGQKASKPTPGKDSADIDVTLDVVRPKSPADAEKTIVKAKAILSSPTGSKETIEEQAEVGTSGDVSLKAKGGPGGKGGKGGDGASGRPGTDGSDATQWSSGGNGGDGGPGGDGGEGTSGANAGKGGRITVRVDADDTDVLVLRKYDYKGGKGGRRGSHGSGGSGGPGGSGGSSYSWTTETKNSDGSTTTHHHSNPGGWDGSRGRSGSTPTSPLHDGDDGDDGSFRIIVEKNGKKIAEYKDRFELDFTGFSVTEENADTFNRPGETLTVSDITLVNSGMMPTPPNHPIDVTIRSSKFLKPLKAKLVLEQSLEPGESYTFDGFLKAEIPLVKAPVDKPLNETDFVRPLATYPSMNRDDDADLPKEFTISQPVRVDHPISSLESLLPGQMTLFEWDVKNHSIRDNGKDSDQTSHVSVRLTLRNPDMAQYFVALDENGNRIDWKDGHSVEIPLLKKAGEKGDSQKIRAYLGVVPDAPHLSKGEIEAELYLGSAKDLTKPEHIQTNTAHTRIEKLYDNPGDADVLVVTNHSTTPEEKAAIEETVSLIGKKAAFWSINAMDGFDMQKEIAMGAANNLMRQFKGKTMVVLNYGFEALGDKKKGKRAEQFITQMDLIKAAESYGIGTVVVNDPKHDSGPFFNERLVPTDKVVDKLYVDETHFLESRPADISKMTGELNQANDVVTYREHAQDKINPMEQTSQVLVKNWWFQEPKLERLHAQALEIQRHLEANNPGQRVIVVSRLPQKNEVFSENDPGTDELKQLTAPTKYGSYGGSLLIMPTVGDSRPHIATLGAPKKEVHSGEFYKGDAFKTALLNELSMEDKIQLLSSVMKDVGVWGSTKEDLSKVMSDKELEELGMAEDKGQLVDKEAKLKLGYTLIDAILTHVATEQNSAAKSDWKPLFGGRELKDKLKELATLATQHFEPADADSEAGKLASRLVAGLNFLGKHQQRWWESRLLGFVAPWNYWRRGPVLREALREVANQIRKDVFISSKKEDTRLVDSLIEAHQKGWYSQLEKMKPEFGKKVAARKAVLSPLVRHGIETDALNDFDRVLTHDRWLEIVSAEEENQLIREDLQNRKAEQRKDREVARDGKPLSNQHPIQIFSDACAKNMGLLAKTKMDKVVLQ